MTNISAEGFTTDHISGEAEEDEYFRQAKAGGPPLKEEGRWGGEVVFVDGNSVRKTATWRWLPAGKMFERLGGLDGVVLPHEITATPSLIAWLDGQLAQTKAVGIELGKEILRNEFKRVMGVR